MIASRSRDVRSGIRWRPAALGVASIAAVVGGHALASSRPMDEASPLVVFTHLYAVLLTGALLLLATALGRAVLRRCDLEGGSRIEHGLFAVAVGLGLIAFLVVGLGLAQLLRVHILALMLCALSFAIRSDLGALVRELPSIGRDALALRRRLRSQGSGLALLLPLVEILFVALLVHTLAPPTSNDVLTYHLQGPRRFLESGGLVPMLDLQQANMPLAVNMLYLVGLAFGSDEMGATLHLALSALVAAATLSFGRRFFGERVGWLAATTFVSTQMMLVFATVAFVDYGFALFDFLAVYAFVLWRASGRRGWLVVSGTLVGCAMASKLLGGVTALSLGIWLLTVAVRERRRSGLSRSTALLLAFALPAFVAAAPWFAKNLVWFGNPVWPFLASNPHDFNMYLGGTTRFGDSGGLVGWLSLPLRLYVEGSIEYPAIRPPLQLLVIPLYLFLPKHRLVTTLLCLAAVQLTVWSLGAHLLRYVVQALPALSIVAAYVVERAIRSQRRATIARPLAVGLMLLALAFPTVIAVAAALAEDKVSQLVGLESRQAYLDRMLDNGRLVTYLNEDHEGVSRVLLVGDNRGFYLDRPVWVDVSLEVFQGVALAPDATTARTRLAERGISHVMVNTRDLTWYARFDPEGRMQRWLAGFDAGRAGYLVPVVSNGASTLYRVVD